MLTYSVAFVLAMAVAALITPLVAHVAHAYGWLDAPGHRKVHTRAVPRLGGVAIVCAFFAPIAGLAMYTNRISGFLYQDGNLVVGLLVGGALIALLGVYDDLKGADAKIKLVVQGLVAVGMWWAGFRIQLFSVPIGDGVAELGRLSLPLTTLWFIGVINALNLIDGLDGLASGIALFAVLVLFGVSYSDNVVLLCLLTAALAGALVGFLFFNFNPAKIFLGDTGSMFLGFVLAAISVWTQRKGATAVALAIPVLALGVPILDVTLSVVRRVGRGRNPFQADREHVHHRLLALGLTHRGAVIWLYGLSGVFAIASLALLRNDTTTRALALSVIGAGIVVIIRKVGVIRFPSIFRQADGTSTGLRHELRSAARSIRGARLPEDAWATLTQIVERLGCDEARLAWGIASSEGAGALPRAPSNSSGQNAATRSSAPAADVSSSTPSEGVSEHEDSTQDGSSVPPEFVFHWHRRSRTAREDWHVEGAPNRTVVRMALDEDGVHLGELAVLLARREMRGERIPEFRIALELLRDALIDFLVTHLEKRELFSERPMLRLATDTESLRGRLRLETSPGPEVSEVG